MFVLPPPPRDLGGVDGDDLGSKHAAECSHRGRRYWRGAALTRLRLSSQEWLICMAAWTSLRGHNTLVRGSHNAAAAALPRTTYRS